MPLRGPHLFTPRTTIELRIGSGENSALGKKKEETPSASAVFGLANASQGQRDEGYAPRPSRWPAGRSNIEVVTRYPAETGGSGTLEDRAQHPRRQFCWWHYYQCRHRSSRVPLSPESPVPRDPPGDFGRVLRLRGVSRETHVANAVIMTARSVRRGLRSSPSRRSAASSGITWGQRKPFHRARSVRSVP